MTTFVHPSFVRAAALPEPLRSHFPKSDEEAAVFVPMQRVVPLARRVLVLAVTRIECAWCAYIDAVPGQRHDLESDAVLDHGVKLDERVARVLFPEFHAVPYAN